MKRLILVLVLMTFVAVDANAVTRDLLIFCDDMKAGRKALKSDLSEAPFGVGQTVEGWAVELYRSKDGATWTLLIHYPESGETCVLERGDNWIDIKWVDPAGRSS